MAEELKRTRSNLNPLPQPPRTIDAFWLSSERFPSNADVTSIVKDTTPTPSPVRSRTSSNEDKFRLSPVPATIPIPAISSHTQTFKALTEDSDTEDLRYRNPYLTRSIQAIPVRPPVPRTPSNSSIITRNGMNDMDTARSLPRGSVDVQMGSCSSSPSVSNFQYGGPRERRNDNASPVAMITDSPLIQRPSGTRRGSLGPHRDVVHDQEAQLRELREILEHRTPTTMGPPSPPHAAPQSRRYDAIETPRRRSANSSTSGTRNTSPVRQNPSTNTTGTTTVRSISPPAPSTNFTQQQHGGHLQPQRQLAVSRASTAAAIQAEQQRARANSLKEQSLTHVTPTRERDRDRDLYQSQQLQQQSQQMKGDTPGYQHPQFKPPYARRQSADSVRGTRPSGPPPAASNLARTLWSIQVQEAQRV